MVAAVVLLVLCASPATVVLLGQDADSALTSALVNELKPLGITVVTATATGSDTETLEDLARDLGGFAVVRTERSRRGVEVWVFDRTTGKHVMREVVALSRASTDSRLLAVRTVELLRASLLEVRLPQTPAAPAPLPTEALALVPAPAAPPPEPPPGVVELGLAGSVLAPLGGLPVAPQATVSVGWHATPRLTLLGAVGLPVWPTLVTRTAGQTSAWLSLATVGAAWQLPLFSRVSLSLDAAVGALWWRVSGAATQGFTGGVVDSVAVVLSAGTRVLVRLTSHLSVGLGLAVLAQPNSFILRLGDEDVGTLGPVQLEGTAGLWWTP